MGLGMCFHAGSKFNFPHPLIFHIIYYQAQVFLGKISSVVKEQLGHVHSALTI